MVYKDHIHGSYKPCGIPLVLGLRTKAWDPCVMWSSGPLDIARLLLPGRAIRRYPKGSM